MGSDKSVIGGAQSQRHGKGGAKAKPSLSAMPLLCTVCLLALPVLTVLLIHNLELILSNRISLTILQSSWYRQYRQFLAFRLPNIAEVPLPEISAHLATEDKILEMSKNFTFPVVIRNSLSESEAVWEWYNRKWWLERYPEETLSVSTGMVTVREFFDAFQKDEMHYISHDREIFDRHPELHDMVDNEQLQTIKPGRHRTSELFMGFHGRGTDIRCDMDAAM